MKVRAHQLPEVYTRKYGSIANFREITHDPKKGEGWISTTTTLFNPTDSKVYAGLTQMDGDILYAFDRETGAAECCEYQKIRVDHEVKVHRSLQVGPDGKLYGGSAGLITVKTRDSAPGGQLWSYDPATKEWDAFGIPSSQDYVQHVVYDFERKMAYGCTYPVPFFFAFDLEKRETKFRSYIGAYPHRSAIADDGKVWSGYSMSADIGDGMNMLFTYDPDTNEITHHDTKLPCIHQKENRQIDDLVNLGDGYLYGGTVAGTFFRIDTKTGEPEFLGKPAQGIRLCGVDEGPDGRIYLTTGAYYFGLKGEDAMTRAFAYDRETKQFEHLGDIVDPEFGDRCVVVHSLSVDDEGTLWVGETDNGERSGCLWECRPE